MRVPNTSHTSRPWRIRELTSDFRLEDVWELPETVGADDLPLLAQMIAASDPSQSASLPVRVLFAIRWKLGAMFGWDDADTGVGSRVPTLRDRLPSGRGGEAVPVVELVTGPDLVEPVLQSIRRALHVPRAAAS